MQTYELVIEMKLLERRLTLYEEKYGILSPDFYGALMSGSWNSTMSMMKRAQILATGKAFLRLGSDANRNMMLR